MRYKTHRGVDSKHEVITSTKVTPGSVDDGEMLDEMIKLHENNTQKEVETVVADSKYGTIDNFLLCHDLGVTAHMPFLERTQKGSGRRKGIFSKQAFQYDPETDTFICPASQRLTRQHYNKARGHYEYRAPKKACARCALRDKCTHAKGGRTLKRHLRQDEVDHMYTAASTREARRDIKKRQDLSERSFAWSTRYGYKRARWRRLWRMEIQDFLIAAIQNITILIKQTNRKNAQGEAQTKRKGRHSHTNTLFFHIGLLVRKFLGQCIPEPLLV